MPTRRSRPSPGLARGPVTAVVKWFNPAKGFGFVQPSDGSPDAFLHISVAEQFGRRDLPPGATVVCDLVDGNRGAQVAAIHSIDESTATDEPPSMAPRRMGPGMGFGSGMGGGPSPMGSDDEGPIDGVVKFFNADKGFGFIRPDDGSRDVFVSARTLTKAGLATLATDQRVRVMVRYGDKGPMASTIDLL